ncbi:hypothetical protein GCM10028775_55260 [Catellatospora paridis]
MDPHGVPVPVRCGQAGVPGRLGSGHLEAVVLLGEPGQHTADAFIGVEQGGPAGTRRLDRTAGRIHPWPSAMRTAAPL